MQASFQTSSQTRLRDRSIAQHDLTMYPDWRTDLLDLNKLGWVVQKPLRAPVGLRGCIMTRLSETTK
jgi:hypothetical protein